MYAWLPQVRMINVAVIFVLFLCFEWMCAWPHTSGKVRPLPTTQYTSCHLPHRCSGLPHSNKECGQSIHMSSLDVAVCSSKAIACTTLAHLLCWEFSLIVLSHAHCSQVHRFTAIGMIRLIKLMIAAKLVMNSWIVANWLPVLSECLYLSATVVLPR